MRQYDTPYPPIPSYILHDTQLVSFGFWKNDIAILLYIYVYSILTVSRQEDCVCEFFVTKSMNTSPVVWMELLTLLLGIIGNIKLGLRYKE